MAESTPTLDRGAAVTRSLLGWGVVAGPFYVVIGLVLALTRPGFDLTRHALSMLTLGDLGGLQRANLVLTGCMVIAAALGITRAIRNGRGLAIGVLVAVDGVALVLSAVFIPDPGNGFPPGTVAGSISASGVLHLVFGAIGFVAMAAAAFAHSSWSRRTTPGRAGAASLLAGLVILIGFFGGAALATSPVGIALLWLAVLTQFGWLALASAQIYAWSPHPLGSRSGQ
jgi:hypothetical membrane protein